MHIQNYDIRIIDQKSIGGAHGLNSALTRHLLNWWLGFDARYPRYADFDITEHLHIADNIFLVRVIDPDMFEIRLCGEAVTEVIGTNNMGRVIHTEGPENDPVEREYVRLARYYRTIVQTGRSYTCFGRMTNRYDLVKRFESVDCPMFGADGQVTHIIGVLVPVTGHEAGQVQLCNHIL